MKIKYSPDYKTHWDALGLDTTTEYNLRKLAGIYRERMLENHPDKIVDLNASKDDNKIALDKATEITKILNQAIAFFRQYFENLNNRNDQFFSESEDKKSVYKTYNEKTDQPEFEGFNKKYGENHFINEILINNDDIKSFFFSDNNNNLNFEQVETLYKVFRTQLFLISNYNKDHETAYIDKLLQLPNQHKIYIINRLLDPWKNVSRDKYKHRDSILKCEGELAKLRNQAFSSCNYDEIELFLKIESDYEPTKEELRNLVTISHNNTEAFKILKELLEYKVIQEPELFNIIIKSGDINLLKILHGQFAHMDYPLDNNILYKLTKDSLLKLATCYYFDTDEPNINNLCDKILLLTSEEILNPVAMRYILPLLDTDIFTADQKTALITHIKSLIILPANSLHTISMTKLMTHLTKLIKFIGVKDFVFVSTEDGSHSSILYALAFTEPSTPLEVESIKNLIKAGCNPFMLAKELMKSDQNFVTKLQKIKSPVLDALLNLPPTTNLDEITKEDKCALFNHLSNNLILQTMQATSNPQVAKFLIEAGSIKLIDVKHALGQNCSLSKEEQKKLSDEIKKHPILNLMDQTLPIRYTKQTYDETSSMLTAKLNKHFINPFGFTPLIPGFIDKPKADSLEPDEIKEIIFDIRQIIAHTTAPFKARHIKRLHQLNESGALGNESKECYKELISRMIEVSLSRMGEHEKKAFIGHLQGGVIQYRSGLDESFVSKIEASCSPQAPSK